jgi:hypothetical protein
MAVRRTKKHSGKKSSKKSMKSESGSGETKKMFCVQCRREGRDGHVMIHNVKKLTFKVKGTTRARLVGKCEHNHKWTQFTKL